MNVGVMAVVFGRVKGMGVMKAFATHAERLGFSTLWAPEHVVLMDQYRSRYPYSSQGKFVGDGKDPARHRYLPGPGAQSPGAG
jgi:alkanesulfonate monooxygenase SsuD/methylene tetrahydromethanopterin reductase-like flavin-dependent oxidoreductase (luciferase family)